MTNRGTITRKLLGLLLVLIGMTQGGCIIPFLWGKSHTLDMDARDTETIEIPEETDIVVVGFYSRHIGRSDSYEALNTLTVSPEGTVLKYPFRFCCAYLVPRFTLFCSSQYPGVIAFAEDRWPTIYALEGNRPPSHRIYKEDTEDTDRVRLIFYSRRFLYDRMVGEAAGLRGEQGASLTRILRWYRDDLIRSVKRSKITPAQKAMVFEQLLDLLSQDRMAIREAEMAAKSDGDQETDETPHIGFYPEIEKDLREALDSVKK